MNLPHQIFSLWLTKAADSIWRFIFHTLPPDHGTRCSQQQWISSFWIACNTSVVKNVCLSPHSAWVSPFITSQEHHRPFASHTLRHKDKTDDLGTMSEVAPLFVLQHVRRQQNILMFAGHQNSYLSFACWSLTDSGGCGKVKVTSPNFKVPDLNYLPHIYAFEIRRRNRTDAEQMIC